MANARADAGRRNAGQIAAGGRDAAPAKAVGVDAGRTDTERTDAGRVDHLYRQLKDMAVRFRIRPGARLNEVALARELNASRTPLREALNRLVAERLIDFQPGRGFFCRELDAPTVFALYEMRAILEEAAIRRACERATDADIAALRTNEFSAQRDYSGVTIGEATAADEAFHLAIAGLSANEELERTLAGINDRIRFIRWVDMNASVARSKSEHDAIMAALAARDADRAAAAMRLHIARRMDQIVAAVREGFSNIYVAGPDELAARRIDTATD